MSTEGRHVQMQDYWGESFLPHDIDDTEPRPHPLDYHSQLVGMRVLPGYLTILKPSFHNFEDGFSSKSRKLEAIRCK